MTWVLGIGLGILGAAVLLVVGFIVYRWFAFKKECILHEERIAAQIDDLGIALRDGKPPAPAVVAERAARPELRPMLYAMLKYFERLDLFPEELITREEHAKSALAFWLCHPCESNAPPEQIELIKEMNRPGPWGDQGRFYVLRFREKDSHRGDVWLLGLAGPFFDADLPYDRTPAFSRFDPEDKCTPEEFVDWYVAMVTRKHGRRS